MSHPAEIEEYDAASTVGNQSLRAAAVSRRRRGSRPKAAPAEEEARRRIALKAYQLFERRGCVDGHDLDDWLEAERLVLAEIEQSASAGR